MEEPLRDSVQQTLQKWIQERHHALLEQVLLTWEEGTRRLNPDDELLDRLTALAAPAAQSSPFPNIPADTDRDLGAGLELIETAASQGETLKRLLEAIQSFAERSAIFVVKQGIATLYASRGFESDNPRPGTPVVPPPDLDALIQGKSRTILKTGQGYAALLAPLSRFEASDARLIPLQLRHRVVALVLVDSGLRQVLDHPNHVRALAHAAEVALANLAVAKDEDKAAAPPAKPQRSAPSAPPATEAVPPHAMSTQHIVDPITISDFATLDPKVRTNAERSARVLIGDIELYFPQKVEQGRAKGNLYTLLKDELERSRASFVERYGAEVENNHHIFYQTVVAQLCGGNANLLGATPWQERK